MPAHRRPPLPTASNDNECAALRPRRFAKLRRRIALGFTFSCLLGGAALEIAGGRLDSVIISHASRSALIFGLVGLRRVADESEPGIDDQA